MIVFPGRAIKFLFLIIPFALLLSACGGSGGGGGGTPPPQATISNQPAAATVYETQTATFSVAASGSGTLSYQWKKNSTAISGATSSSFSTPATVLADNGTSFSVEVTDNNGTVTSSAALLTVQSLITTPPTNQSVIAGQAATFTVTAAGLPSLTYQWLKNGQAITGATSSSYTTPVTISDNASAYAVTVRNGAGTSVTSSTASLSVQASSLTHLVISEVATCYFYNVDCWFEIYNPTSSAIDLVNYQVKSTAVDVTSGAVSTVTFNLLNRSVPADGYVIISGNVSNAAQRGMQMQRVRTGNISPFWTANGFIELLSAGATVDFVRFGTSAQIPVTPSQWPGSSIATLPSSATDYGKSIVRLYPGIAATDTDAAGDWTLVNWSTPAGRNDVPASAVDADGDGIPNTAKTAGGTFAGIDLYAMGARAGQKDVFISVNRMTSNDPGIIPRAAALQKVVDSFNSRNIKIHFDAGTMFSGSFSVANFNLGQGYSVVYYEPCVAFDQLTCSSNVSTYRSVYDWKVNMDMRRWSIFHYLLFGNSQNVDGTSGSSGRAELPGNDFIVTMGNWGFSTTAGSALNMLINMQASTVMHELGHNLGLMHGGFENTNYKPNYWSVMNYLYQLEGLDGNPSGSTAYQRWRNQKGGDVTPTPSLCSLANSPCGSPSQFIMDYSDGTSSSLDETSLLESSNIGRGSTAGAYADWDKSSSLTATPQVKDLNGDAAQTTLRDSNDWGSLSLPFSRSYNVNSGISQSSSSLAIVPNPISDDRQPVSVEVAPTPFFMDQLRNVH
jgi:Immunoglobulin I-set domain